MIFNAACVFIQQFLFAAPFFFFPERAPHVLQLSLRPQGGPLSLIERRSRRGRWEEGSWWWPPLRQTRRELRGFNIQPVVPVFMIREASKPDLVVGNAEEIIDAAAAACESLWTSSKTLMQIDNVASLSLSLPLKYKEGTCKPREPNVCEV